jgi:hypothetical protein
MPPKPPRGQALPLAQPRAQQALPDRRGRREHVTRNGQRGRSGKDRRRLWQEGGRDRGRASGCARPNGRVRLPPWQPMV